MRDTYRIVHGWNDWEIQVMRAYGNVWEYVTAYSTFDQAAQHLKENYGLAVSVVVPE